MSALALPPADPVPVEVLWSMWQRVYPLCLDAGLRARHGWIVDRLQRVHFAACHGDGVAFAALGCWWRTIWTDTALNGPAQGWMVQAIGDPRLWLMRRDRGGFLPGVVRAMTAAEDLEPGFWRPAARAEAKAAMGCVALPVLAPPGEWPPVHDVLALDPGDPARWWSLTGCFPDICGFAPEHDTTWRLFAGPLDWLRAGMPEDGGAILDLDEAIWQVGEWAEVHATDVATAEAYHGRREALLRPKRPKLPRVLAETHDSASEEHSAAA